MQTYNVTLQLYMNNFNLISYMKIMTMCYNIDIIEHGINYNIHCLHFALVECSHLLDDWVAQQFLEGQFVFG